MKIQGIKYVNPLMLTSMLNYLKIEPIPKILVFEFE